jgi:hypothetical protein
VIHKINQHLNPAGKGAVVGGFDAVYFLLAKKTRHKPGFFERIA